MLGVGLRNASSLATSAVTAVHSLGLREITDLVYYRDTHILDRHTFCEQPQKQHLHHIKRTTENAPDPSHQKSNTEKRDPDTMLPGKTQ